MNATQTTSRLDAITDQSMYIVGAVTVIAFSWWLLDTVQMIGQKFGIKQFNRDARLAKYVIMVIVGISSANIALSLWVKAAW